MPNLTITFIYFILGSSIGSFLSVFITRHHNQEKGIISGRSKCPNCNKKLTPRDLIPLLSFAFSKGKCRHCKKEIGKHYFYLELITGAIFAFWTIQIPLHLNFSILALQQFIFALILSTILIAIFFYDLLYQEIPDALNVPGIIIAAIAALTLGTPSLESIGIAVAIIAVFFGGQILISKGQWLGLGDLILGLFMATLLGWPKIILAISLAYIIGACFALPLLLNGKAKGRTEIAFGPFLVVATFITWIWGDQIIVWYLSTLGL